ncbi:CU044_5270 family protein [Streptomyces sp. WP-1]|uniref:CU044_5270 family protein n=1 Tax=Streptomyces sp. WP-1 TaxID=3041497 RepID=UPI00264881EA|nr:CU044_5270 family protein [Streptomyces sp. WP-1]WKE68221.1 CU044_5270 family protein [Streptomyces sp. WP-1]
MNDRHASAERHDDRDEIARLLPAPADWDLPREQHLRHKDLLMRHIDRDQAESTAPEPAAAPVRRARPPLRPALVASAAALALAAAGTAGAVLSGTGGHDDAAARHAAADMRPAAALLHRISNAAAHHGTLTVRDDQFLYTREKVREADLTSGKAVVSPLKDAESWMAQQPGPLHRLGLSRTDGETLPINAELGDTKGTPAGLSRPTYNWLASLPTDPDKLLAYLYAKTPAAEGRERDQAVFEQIGGLLGGLMPPRTAAALYQAAAKIPGVDRSSGARDAIGRQGLGIVRDDKRYGVRTEWVFDTRDYSFLGSRSYLTKDTSYGKAGTLLFSSAELAHAVVDKAGVRPAAEDGSGTA